jgi:RimJ/RimL family protein N-acetyltransferase
MELRLIDEEILDALLNAAVTDAEPDEVMPPVEGPPGWTTTRIEAFRAFHRERFGDLDNALRTTMYAIIVDGQVAGMIRLSRKDEDATFETGMWLRRSRRGQGLGTAAVRAVLVRAGEVGARTVVADTTPANAAALGALRGCGAALTERSDKVYAALDVPIAGS